jgi:uncharacterized membrane protein
MNEQKKISYLKYQLRFLSIILILITGVNSLALSPSRGLGNTLVLVMNVIILFLTPFVLIKIFDEVNE